MLPALCLAALAPSLADRVLVVENESSPISVDIATDYMARRKVKKLVKVTCPDSATDQGRETLAYADFQKQIEGPVKEYLAKHVEIDFIVLTKGVPIRLTGAPTGLGNDRPSLDSTLACMGYDKKPEAKLFVINDSGFKGKAWINRFWNSSERFNHTKFGGYLVTRLDGYTREEAMSLTAYAVTSEKQPPVGEILIDAARKDGLALDKVPMPSPADNMSYPDYDADLTVCASKLKDRNMRVIFDNAEEFVGGKTGLMGYCSWGSNDPHYNADHYHSLRFDPGAIAETAVSTSGRTFLPTTGGQSLIADLIHQRVTGCKGYCDEPFLNAIASPTVLMDRYTRGWTLAESFFAASRFVGWEDIVIGDPLCSPYARH